MHPIQEKLLLLSKVQDLSLMSLRKMAESIEMPNESPQKIKHHLSQLEKKGFFRIEKFKGIMGRDTDFQNDLLGEGSILLSIPVIGTANCGPANVFSETNFEGFLRISSRLLHKNSADGLFAIKADGSSMNRAEIAGKRLEDGDYAIIDSNQKSPLKNDVVLAIIDNKATIKRFIEDKENDQIVLLADSSYDYEPIYLHADDEFSINGKVISVIKRPNSK
ncbi:MAG TPA: S24 family peptidase [Hanamia sp.]